MLFNNYLFVRNDSTWKMEVIILIQILWYEKRVSVLAMELTSDITMYEIIAFWHSLFNIFTEKRGHYFTCDIQNRYKVECLECCLTVRKLKQWSSVVNSVCTFSTLIPIHIYGKR